MSKVNDFFTNMKRNLPVHVQWLLLFAAFLVVVILLLLVVSGPRQTTTQTPEAAVQVRLLIDPSEIEWRDVTIGEAMTQRIEVSATTDVRVADVKISGLTDADEIGLIQQSTCANIGIISPRIPCTITLEFKPNAPLRDTGAEIQIIYHSATQPANMSETERIPIMLSAIDKEIAEPEPFGLMAFEPEDEFAFDDFDFTFSAVEPEFDFEDDFDDFFEPAPIAVAPPAPEPAIADCYEFAFTGFNMTGQSAGRIRADSGRFLFHPFGDPDCRNPTGVYNPDTGLIYDINNRTRVIGSDAERIGMRGIGPGAAVPTLSRAPNARTFNRARQSATPVNAAGGARRINMGAPRPTSSLLPSSIDHEATVSSVPFDRTFVLRQFKPIPATIVSEIRADPRNISRLPVTATVDRHVYSDNGRTIILPAGTQMLGFVTGELPGPYRAIGRMDIDWYRFIRPDGVEFNFMGDRPFSADSQGRMGVPGYGSTDFIESMIMPMITAVVPAAVNLIAPISDRFVNQIDLDNNTVTQHGTVRSSELAKQEIITTWNRVVQKLALDIIDNTTPPFSIAAGTRITVFSPTDLVVTCGPNDTDSRRCAIIEPSRDYARPSRPGEDVTHRTFLSPDSSEWIGQVRSLNMQDLSRLCDTDPQTGISRVRRGLSASQLMEEFGITDFRTAEFMCSSGQYQAINQARWDAYFQQQRQGIVGQGGQVLQPGSQDFNREILGMQFSDHGQMLNPFSPPPPPPPVEVLTCDNGMPPDMHGCCTGETLTDMGPDGFNCCPDAGGDCFPPIM